MSRTRKLGIETSGRYKIKSPKRCRGDYYSYYMDAWRGDLEQETRKKLYLLLKHLGGFPLEQFKSWMPRYYGAGIDDMMAGKLIPKEVPILNDLDAFFRPINAIIHTGFGRRSNNNGSQYRIFWTPNHNCLLPSLNVS